MGNVSKCETTRFSPEWCTSDLAQILGVPEMSLLQRNGQNARLRSTMTDTNTYETIFVEKELKDALKHFCLCWELGVGEVVMVA